MCMPRKRIDGSSEIFICGRTYAANSSPPRSDSDSWRAVLRAFSAPPMSEDSSDRVSESAEIS